jgi:hypothetical protein
MHFSLNTCLSLGAKWGKMPMNKPATTSKHIIRVYAFKNYYEKGINSE